MAENSFVPSFDVNLDAAAARSSEPVGDAAPFRMLVFGDLSGRKNRNVNKSDDLATRKLISIDRDNFDEVLTRLEPTLQLRLGSDEAAPTQITFRELDDFHPDRLFERVELFEHLRRMRRRLMNKDLFPEAAAELTAGTIASVSAPQAQPQPPASKEQPDEASDISTEDLLDAALEATDQSAGTGGGNPFERLIQEIVAPYIEPAADPRQPEFVAAVDEAIGEQMRRLLHHPDLQALESAWRGIDFLIRRLETDSKLKLQLLDVSVDEIAADLTRSEDLSQSSLWKLLYEQSIGIPGNDPFACLVGLFDAASTKESIRTCAGLAAIAEQLNAPLLAGVESRFAGCESFAASADPADWKSPLDDDVATLWKEFRSRSAAGYACFLAPRFLIRLPYGKKTDPAESFAFEEMRQPPEHEDYLWCPSSVLAALLLGSGYTECGWQLRPEASLEVDGLPVHVFEVDGDREQQPCAEAWLTERSGSALADGGLTSVYSIRSRDAALLPGLRNTSVPSGPLAGRWD